MADLHALDREEGGQVGSEGGQHEDDEQPVGGDEGATAESLGSFTPSLRGERGQGEPEALLESELSVSKTLIV